MGFLFYCSRSHSASHLFYKLGCMYAAPRGNPVWDSLLIAARVVPVHYLHSSSAALHPPKKSLWDPTMNRSFIGGGRGNRFSRAALCFLSGRRGIQHGSPCGEGHVPQHSVTLQISSPPQSQPESPFSPPPPLESSSDKFDLAARGRPFPGKENKYCYNGNNIYLERWRQTAAGPLKETPLCRRIAALFLFMKAAVMHISAN